MNYVGVAEVAAQQDGVVTLEQCQRFGLSWNEVRNRCRSGRWRPAFRTVYYAGTEPEIPWRARVRAAVLSTGPDAAAVLFTAARWHGIAGAPLRDEVTVSVPGSLRRLHQPGLQVYQLELAESDVMTVDGLRVTTPERTLADGLLRTSRIPAVSMLDSALHLGLVEQAGLTEVERLMFGRRGVIRARGWLAQADGRAESPLETRVRLICRDGRLPAEELQYPVHDFHGTLLARADLAWPSRRVLAEADGEAVHGAPVALFRDRWRQNELIARGYTVLRFTWEDTRHPAQVTSAVRRALAAATAAAARAS